MAKKQKKLVLKTDAEIKAEIATLKEIKPKVRRYSGFGDDHWAQIDVQIEVLEGNLDEDDLGRYQNPDHNSLAYDTIQWRDGHEVDYGPVESWKELVRP